MIYLGGLLFIVVWVSLARYGFNDDDFWDK